MLRLTEVATEEPTALTPDTFAEMAERMKDRRPTIRRTSMLCLARLYARHVSGRFTDFASVMTCSGSTQTALHQYFGSCSDVWTLLKPVPGYIISCWGYPEFVDKQLVMQLLQEYIIPRYEYNNCSNVSPNLVRPGSPSVADSYEVMPDVNECSSGRLEASEGTRASALIAMWVSLDAAGRSGLASILGFKTKVDNLQKDVSVDSNKIAFIRSERLLQSF